MPANVGVLDPWFSAYPLKGRGRDVDWLHALKDFWPAVLALVAAFKFWLDAQSARRAEARAKAAEDETKAVQRTDLIKIAQEAAGAVIANLHAELDRMQKQLVEVQAEFATFRKAHDSMIADKEAELALLRGRVRSLEAERDALTRLLDAHGIPHPPTAQPFFELRDGRVDPVLPTPMP